MAVALLSVTGLLEEARLKLGKLKNGLYGVRSVLTTLVVMALLRCKRPEPLKGFDPTELGAVLGLCRAPEMKTLRRKFKQLADKEDGVVDLVRAMAKRHAERARDAIAFLYADGHVRPYLGDKKLGKAHHTGMRIALPATTDYWICDAKGAPVLVVVTEGNLGMTKVMKSLLEEIRQAVGPEVKPTVIFDRGGYSAEVFALLVKMGFDFMTYRKGPDKNFLRKGFKPLMIRRGGREVETLVRDGKIRRKGLGLVRCVAVLRPDGHQTHVLTTRTDLTAVRCWSGCSPAGSRRTCSSTWENPMPSTLFGPMRRWMQTPRVLCPTPSGSCSTASSSSSAGNARRRRPLWARSCIGLTRWTRLSARWSWARNGTPRPNWLIWMTRSPRWWLNARQSLLACRWGLCVLANPCWNSPGLPCCWEMSSR